MQLDEQGLWGMGWALAKCRGGGRPWWSSERREAADGACDDDSGAEGLDEENIFMMSGEMKKSGC